MYITEGTRGVSLLTCKYAVITYMTAGRPAACGYLLTHPLILLSWHKQPGISYAYRRLKCTYTISDCIQRLAGFKAFREYSSSDPASRVYIEVGQPVLNITQNSLGLETSRSRYIYNECCLVVMPQINFHVPREESIRRRQSAKSADSAFSKCRFTPTF